jgi:hypothetical protein
MVTYQVRHMVHATFEGWLSTVIFLVVFYDPGPTLQPDLLALGFLLLGFVLLPCKYTHSVNDNYKYFVKLCSVQDFQSHHCILRVVRKEVFCLHDEHRLGSFFRQGVFDYALIIFQRLGRRKHVLSVWIHLIMIMRQSGTCYNDQLCIKQI